MHRSRVAAAALLGLPLIFLAASAQATPVTFARSENNTDYMSFAVGGVGDGPADITVSGLTGNVRKAFLYWHGVDLTGSGGDGIYDAQNVTLDGEEVTGQSLGDASTNCWGSGSSRAFFADVTDIVDGNGTYTFLPELKTGHDTNGATLVVLFNDGNGSNNRDLVFFEGNDSDAGGSVGDPTGWQATLNDINYGGGSVLAQLHVADGQAFGPGDDNPVTFTSAEGMVTINDTANLFDGNSVPDAGNDRASNGSLWDLHTFDITGAFNEPGTYSLSLAQTYINDCHSLVVTMIDLAAGAAPCGNGTINEGEECDPAAVPTGCSAPESCLNSCTCGCDSNSDCNDGEPCTVDTCNLETGACTNNDDLCGCPRDCGDPADDEGVITAVDAGFILNVAVEILECLPCVCDVDDNGSINATDALKDLQFAVDLPGELNCPEFVLPAAE
ncbi:MAG TPA: hypothetical protein VEC57_16280 [Candidatus Limnocylindrales bacterium]|nr:hypothetical protein [Candidatus Limnocylindrales bacterium]